MLSCSQQWPWGQLCSLRPHPAWTQASLTPSSRQPASCQPQPLPRRCPPPCPVSPDTHPTQGSLCRKGECGLCLCCWAVRADAFGTTTGQPTWSHACGLGQPLGPTCQSPLQLCLSFWQGCLGCSCPCSERERERPVRRSFVCWGSCRCQWLLETQASGSEWDGTRDSSTKKEGRLGVFSHQHCLPHLPAHHRALWGRRP